jgi:hypothetical protein
MRNDFNLTFSEVSTKLSSLMNISINQDEYDSIMVKNIAASNAGTIGTSNQYHIAITGEGIGFFPLLYNNLYFQKNISDAKRYFLLKIPVFLKKEVITYLSLNSSLGNSDVTCDTCTVISRPNTPQLELGDEKNDSNEWKTFKTKFEADGYLIFIKRKGELLYDVFAIKKADSNGLTEDVATINFGLKNNGASRTIIDINSMIPISSIATPSQHQVIFYGSPGTGKSHKADEITNGKNVLKVTFHPDYDYHSFVGSYKPTMIGEGIDAKIAYKFVPQIFTKIYIDAWKNMVSPDETKPFFLQIEEINRGNCAEIFGDLFQLLDRDKDGFSKYEVTAEEELYKYLLSEKGFGGEHTGINEGKLRFPSNLKIIATMNTSDQSLFPMDSAFKRRWDWIYVPIDYKCSSSDFTIQLDNGKAFKWLEFLKSVNKEIFDIDKNQDKQIGNWFIDAQNSGKIISESTFVNKVVFYLWNDVFKDEEKTIFKSADGNNLTYTNFFENDTSNNLVSYILEERLQLTNVGKAETTSTGEE